MKIVRLFAAMAILSVVLLAACASSDTTKVTVYFSKGGHASLEQNKIPLIDRFFSLFSKEAYAQTHDPANTDSYFLWVFGDGMSPIFLYDIPGTQASVTIEVPSGNNRVFTLWSGNGDIEYQYINYVGQTVSNLSGSDQTITVHMYPSTNEVYVSEEGSNFYISWDYDPSLIDEGFQTVKVYRACYGYGSGALSICDGTVTEVNPSATKYLNEASVYDSYYWDNEIDPITAYGNEFYYFVRIDSPNSPSGGFRVPNNLFNFTNTYEFIAWFMTGEYVPVEYNP